MLLPSTPKISAAAQYGAMLRWRNNTVARTPSVRCRAQAKVHLSELVQLTSTWVVDAHRHSAPRLDQLCALVSVSFRRCCRDAHLNVAAWPMRHSDGDQLFRRLI
jgi:hypothetical protein